MIGFRRKVLALIVAALSAPVAPAMAEEAGPTPVTCHAGLPNGTTCYAGRSEQGAWYQAAYPADWNGVLIIYAHGGPRTEEPKPEDAAADLDKFSFLVREGYAWAGSTYRRAGYGVRSAAEDTDQLRSIVWRRFGRPRLTLLHGLSWGGNVAAKVAELHSLSVDGSRNYDGVVLTSAFLAGGSEGYGFRADLRAVYQFYCRNHPRPDEPAYPLWQGLPRDAVMSRADLTARVEACTGLNLAPEARSAAQAAALRNILSVTGLRQAELVAHLAWATNLFQDIVWNRLDGRNPFENVGQTYTGSEDDVALNAGVERFTADPTAVARLAYDSDLSGRIVLPVLTLHARYDPTVSVGHEAMYRNTVAAAGRSDLLVQTFTSENLHSQLSSPEYVAVFDAMTRWLENGQRPSPTEIDGRCREIAERYTERCHFLPQFEPHFPR